MTKVGRLFEEEKIEAVKEATRDTTSQLVLNAYESLGDIEKVAELLKVPVGEVKKIVNK